ncbi:uncharacterized protein KGF55_002856 [Candida pseudojiufengensis]|uniref:uncharacterized protein n=1 Tax=Candida pseudojiufengensis TaxID=497109 RepID=UPI002224F34D|nr:uncharacterized protein KGF55_002856 [Candida pseudojiufengensis]KAI5963064.1 hypothetical protein KGF55_002856 [Candida pseudojiufengensis]
MQSHDHDQQGSRSSKRISRICKSSSFSKESTSTAVCKAENSQFNILNLINILFCNKSNQPQFRSRITVSADLEDNEYFLKFIYKSKSNDLDGAYSSNSTTSTSIQENEKPEISENNERDEFLVTFDGKDDKEDVTNLSRFHKWVIVGIISFGSVCVTCLSSCWSLASENIMEHFNVSREVSVLGISFFILGLGTGGMFLSPISEFHGRKIVYILGLTLMIAFEFLTAFTNNYGSMIFGRFMSGFCGSSFMAVCGGSFSDLFKKKKQLKDGSEVEMEGKDSNEDLALALILYSVSPFLGPSIGPLLSGFINSTMNFRWTFYIMIMWTGLILALVVFFVPETYEPINLKHKAKRLRKETGDKRYYALSERNKTSLIHSVLISSRRPFLLLFFDNMTMVLCFYTGFCLAIVYLFFVAFPYIFRTVYGFDLAAQGMSFLGLATGMVLTCLISPYFVKKGYLYLLKKNNGVPKVEFRFVSLMAGVFVVPIGLFMIAWTSYSSIHWIVPIIGSGIYGSGTILVFNGIFAYSVEAYILYSASAMACNSFVRSVMHWVDKNCLPWSKEYFETNIKNTNFKNDEYEFIITEIDSVTGDCDVTQRKGKVLCIYDMRLQFKIKGSDNSEKSISGTIIVPEFTHDQDSDEYVFEVNSDDLVPEIRKNLVPILKTKLMKFQNDLISAHAQDVQHGSATNTTN